MKVFSSSTQPTDLKEEEWVKDSKYCRWIFNSNDDDEEEEHENDYGAMWWWMEKIWHIRDWNVYNEKSLQILLRILHESVITLKNLYHQPIHVLNVFRDLKVEACCVYSRHTLSSLSLAKKNISRNK